MATAAVRLRQPPPVSPVNYSITTLGAFNLEPRHVGRMVEGKNLGIPYLATRCSKLQGAARRLVRWAKKEESIAIDVHKLVLELTDLGETGSCVHFAQRHVPGATPPWGCSPPQTQRNTKALRRRVSCAGVLVLSDQPPATDLFLRGLLSGGLRRFLRSGSQPRSFQSTSAGVAGSIPVKLGRLSLHIATQNVSNMSHEALSTVFLTGLGGMEGP